MEAYNLNLDKKEIKSYISSSDDILSIKLLDNWDLLLRETSADSDTFRKKADEPDFESSVSKVMKFLNVRNVIYTIEIGLKENVHTFDSDVLMFDSYHPIFNNRKFDYDSSTKTFIIQDEPGLPISDVKFVVITLENEMVYFLRVFDDNNITCKWFLPVFSNHGKEFKVIASYSSAYRDSFTEMANEIKRIVDFMISNLNNFKHAVLKINHTDHDNPVAVGIEEIKNVNVDDHSISINLNVNRKLIKLTNITLLEHNSFIISFPVSEKLFS